MAPLSGPAAGDEAAERPTGALKRIAARLRCGGGGGGLSGGSAHLRGRQVARGASAWMIVTELRGPSSEGGRGKGGAAEPCADRETCLRLVDDFLHSQPRQSYFKGDAGLMQTFGPGSVGGGPCGDEMCKLVEPCPNYAQTPHCRYDVYDNALAAIYLSKRGKLDEARRILDAFIALLYPPRPLPGITVDKSDGLPSNRSIALLAAGFTDAPAQAGQYAGVGVADGAPDTGNNAWVAMAFVHFAAATGEACYADVARDIHHALKVRASCPTNKSPLGGFASRFAPYPHYYRSTEHNIDMYALSRMLGDDKAAALAHLFVHGMYADPGSGTAAAAAAAAAAGRRRRRRCRPKAAATPPAPATRPRATIRCPTRRRRSTRNSGTSSRAPTRTRRARRRRS